MNIPITPKASKYVTKSWIIKESTALLLLGFPHLVVKILTFRMSLFAISCLLSLATALGSAPNVLLTPKKKSRYFMQIPARAWAVDGEEKRTESKGFFFCRETDLNYDLVSCEGYLKNGALASLGLGRGSGAYYGSVVRVTCQQCSTEPRYRMHSEGILT